jgi:hypothetical protein
MLVVIGIEEEFYINVLTTVATHFLIGALEQLHSRLNSDDGQRMGGRFA